MIKIYSINIQEKSNKTKKFFSTLFILYIILLIYTGSSRSFRYDNISNINYDTLYNMNLFSTYIEAWNFASSSYWYQIFSDIILFIPFGFMLPLISKKFFNWKNTYIFSVSFAILIECLLFITNDIYFNIDIILNSFIGAIIGYGLIMNFSYNSLSFINTMIFNDILNEDVSKDNNKLKRYVKLLNIPLITIIILSLSAFSIYTFKDLGNLSFSHSYVRDMSNSNAISSLNFNTSDSTSYIYEPIINNDKTSVIADKVFKALNSKLDTTSIAYSDNDNFYNSFKGDLLTIDDNNMIFSFSKYSLSDSGEALTGLSYDDILDIFKELPITLPSNGNVTEFDNGIYSIHVNMEKINGIIYNGYLNCKIAKDGSILWFSNNINAFTEYKEFDIISEQEAFNKIAEGKFYHPSSKLYPITDIELVYELDSKNFAQPAYKFTLSNTNEPAILIPAIK